MARLGSKDRGVYIQKTTGGEVRSPTNTVQGYRAVYHWGVFLLLVALFLE